MPRYKLRTDNNQAEIVRQLNQIPGVQCDVIGKPVDLVIGYRGRNFFVEIKRPDKINQPSAYTKAQREWIKNWPGQVRVASSFDEIWTLISGAYVEPR